MTEHIDYLAKQNESRQNTHESSGVLVQQAIGAVCRCGQCVGDVLRHRVIGEALAQVDRLIFHGQLHVFVPLKGYNRKKNLI